MSGDGDKFYSDVSVQAGVGGRALSVAANPVTEAETPAGNHAQSTLPGQHPTGALDAICVNNFAGEEQGGKLTRSHGPDVASTQPLHVGHPPADTSTAASPEPAIGPALSSFSGSSPNEQHAASLKVLSGKPAEAMPGVSRNVSPEMQIREPEAANLTGPSVHSGGGSAAASEALFRAASPGSTSAHSPGASHLRSSGVAHDASLHLPLMTQDSRVATDKVEDPAQGILPTTFVPASANTQLAAHLGDAMDGHAGVKDFSNQADAGESAVVLVSPEDSVGDSAHAASAEAALVENARSVVLAVESSGSEVNIVSESAAPEQARETESEKDKDVVFVDQLLDASAQPSIKASEIEVLEADGGIPCQSASPAESIAVPKSDQENSVNKDADKYVTTVDSRDGGESTVMPGASNQSKKRKRASESKQGNKEGSGPGTTGNTEEAVRPMEVPETLEARAMKVGIAKEWLQVPPGPVRLSDFDRAKDLSFVGNAEERLTVQGYKGYRMIRASHGVCEGTWYFEVGVLPPDGSGAVRIGWSTRRSDFDTPVGFDSYGYAVRDVTGQFVHESHLQNYGEPFGPGDVMGCCISLPGDRKKVARELAIADARWLHFRFALYLQGKPPDDCDELLHDAYVEFFKNGKSYGIPGYFFKNESARAQGIVSTGMKVGNYFPSIALFKGAKVSVNFGPDFKFALPEGARAFCSCVPMNMGPAAFTPDIVKDAMTVVLNETEGRIHEEVLEAPAAVEKTGSKDKSKKRPRGSSGPNRRRPSDDTSAGSERILTRKDKASLRWIDSVVAAWKLLSRSHSDRDDFTVDEIYNFACDNWSALCWQDVRHQRSKAALRRVLYYGQDGLSPFEIRKNGKDPDMVHLRADERVSLDHVYLRRSEVETLDGCPEAVGANSD